MPDLHFRPDAALRSEIERTIAPVTPLAAPSGRLVPLIPLAALLLVLSVLVFGLRVDAPALGIGLTWGASILEALVGLLLCGAALREAVPGTPLSRIMIGASFATAGLLVTLVTWLTWLTSPTTIAPRAVAWVWRACLGATILTALPALGVAGFLVSRAFPLRPALAGALYGLGAGLLADAGWRLFCHYSDPVHVFGAHASGVAIAALIGALVARALGRRG